MVTIRVQTEDFDIGAELAALTAGRGNVGGVSCFVGVVRDDSARRLAALILEHYPGMTEEAIGAIAAEAEQRWSLLGCTVLHRVGRLPVGANIVLVMAAAPHRQSALEATAFLIDWLKTGAPFWKQEIFADGAHRWVEARAADAAPAGKQGLTANQKPGFRTSIADFGGCHSIGQAREDCWSSALKKNNLNRQPPPGAP